MGTNICHDNITAKSSKTQIITNTRALIYLGLDGSMTETSDILP